MTPLPAAPSPDSQTSLVSQRLVRAPHDNASLVQNLRPLLDRVQELIPPVWPLADYVAINPYFGLSDRRFLEAERFLKEFSDCELLMPLSYFAERYSRNEFATEDIETAVEELAHDPHQSSPLPANEIIRQLRSLNASPKPPAPAKRLYPVSDFFDQKSGSSWSEIIREEIGKHCAAHYDEGQAAWPSPWKHLPLYQAWRESLRYDRQMEQLGLSGFRQKVAELAESPEEAILQLLEQLQVPRNLWEKVLLCQAFSIPGWCGWVKHQVEKGNASERTADLVGLLAIKLAYDAALADVFSVHVNWDAIARSGHLELAKPASIEDTKLRFTLQRACEIAYRRKLLTTLNFTATQAEPGTESAGASEENPATTPKLARMIFCIDVRSERYRRQLESLSDQVETSGFAGFFGLPIESVPLGEERGTRQVPVLLTPQFAVQDHLDAADEKAHDQVVQRRTATRLFRNVWKKFQSSAASCFPFVETAGWLYGFKLLQRSLQQTTGSTDPKFDGLKPDQHVCLGPDLTSLSDQGISLSQQADMAESILTNLGMTADFARLVVFCGHGSQTENNPLKAGLDCGACGGHSGESNARFAARLLNSDKVRNELKQRGLVIPDKTHFVAALHNTTNDVITFFDEHRIPKTHRPALQRLAKLTHEATQWTQTERLPIVASQTVPHLLKRSSDWSEIRPEWGLAGNAAFIAGPRSLTRDANLNGRVFLHDYDYQLDPDRKVLTQIMTAPMIVAHWINMQYYASTVDQKHFGSGTKTVHNVVGGFGIYSGNGGDLMTGLPWESLHNGKDYQHIPLRLQVAIACPRERIEQVIAENELVKNLLVNGWLSLLAIEEAHCYRYTQSQKWQPLRPSVAAMF